MPGAPDQQDRHAAGNDPPAMRQAAVVMRQRHGLARSIVGAAGNVALEAFDILRRVQPQMSGIGAHETDCIGLARQVFDPVILQRFKVVLADLEGPRHLGDLIAAPEPRRAQVVADRFQRAFAIARDLAQMDAAGIQSVHVLAAVILHGYLCGFGHRPNRAPAQTTQI
jgi:hypothetical protein